MDWNRLIKVYDQNSDKVGVIETGKTGEPNVLLPINFDIGKAGLEIHIDSHGKCKGVKVLKEEDNPYTMFPVTEKSRVRSGKSAIERPHPLFDRITFLSKSIAEFIDDESVLTGNEKYRKNLKVWEESEDVHPYITAIFNYLCPNNGMDSMLSDIKKYTECGEEDIKKMAAGNTLVRFVVDKTEIWLDREFQKLCTKHAENTDVDFVVDQLTGESGIKCEGFAKKIIPGRFMSGAANAKVFSANDKTNYTYRGRFSDVDQALSIGSVSAQKVTNTIRWLVGRQGFKIGQTVYVAWEADGTNVDFLVKGLMVKGMNEQAFKNTDSYDIKKMMSFLEYCSNNPEADTEIMAIGITNPVPGRLSISTERIIKKSDLIRNIIQWYDTTKCMQMYFDSETGQWEEYIGIPSLYNIKKNIWGPNKNGNSPDFVYQWLHDRLQPCMWYGQSLPKDVIDSAVKQVSNPNHYGSDKSFLCAIKTVNSLIRFYNKKE